VNERVRHDVIAGSLKVIPELIGAGNFVWAAKNYAMIADKNTDLGLLHWRRGLDPHPDFERAIEAYESLRALVHEHDLERRNHEFPIVYAMLFLMGHKTTIEFEDEEFHEEQRWPCYQCCLVHALHDQALNERHARLLNQYLAQNDGLADRSVLTYLKLLGMRQTDRSVDELVTVADANWAGRKSDRFFSHGAAFDGHGVMNDIYVDIYLAAVLQKIGWQGESVHRWKWEAPRSAR
jgi:hypothetical protein